MSTRFEGADIGPPIDTLDDILDVTSEVLQEFAPDRSNTRIERLARYLAANLGGDPYQFVDIPNASDAQKATLETCAIWRFRDTLGIELTGTGLVMLLAKSPAMGREIATAILRACELAERIDAPKADGQ